MSRIISFRVWDKEEKKYLLPEQQEFAILPTKPSFGVTILFQSKHYPENLDIDCVDWADADLIMGRYELEQDTGLKDKNGEKIYENDIVLDYYDGEDAFIVKWDEDMASFILTGTDNIASVSFDNFYSNKDLEIIGNMNENPELLGGEE